MSTISQTERIATLESEVSTLRTDVTYIKQAVDAIASIQQSSKTTNWTLIFSSTAAVALIFGGLFSILRAEQEKASLRAELELLRYVQPVVVSAEQSKSDRGSLHSKVDENSQKIGELAGKVSANYAEARSSLTEVEAQFKGVGNIQNLRQAENQKMIGLLWQKVYRESIPDIHFWPSSHREFLPQ